MGEQAHPETECPRRAISLPMRPKPDDAERGAGDLLAEQQGRRPGFPFAGADVVDRFADAPGGGHQQREGHIGGGIGEDARGVADRYFVAGCGREIDIVVSDSQIADNLELRLAFEDILANRLGQKRNHAIGAGQQFRQFLGKRGQVIGPTDNVDFTAFLRFCEQLLAEIRQRSRDHNPKRHSFILPADANMFPVD